MGISKLKESLDDLHAAIAHYRSMNKNLAQQKRLAFLSLSKAFEVAVEYAWKALKRKVMDEGMDPQSPKAAIRDAAKIGLIENAQEWLEFVTARNSGVHDYFSIPERDYVKIAEEFLAKARKELSA